MLLLLCSAMTFASTTSFLPHAVGKVPEGRMGPATWSWLLRLGCEPTSPSNQDHVAGPSAPSGHLPNFVGEEVFTRHCSCASSRRSLRPRPGPRWAHG